MMLGLLLVAFAAAIAQTPSQTDQKKKTEACCSMESCCNGDSCPMNAERTATTATDAKDGCCCCSGDSCDMKMKDKMKNHADDHECGACCSDSCDTNMKHDAAMKHDMNMKHDMKSDGAKHECCNMKHKDMKSKAKQKAA